MHRRKYCRPSEHITTCIYTTPGLPKRTGRAARENRTRHSAARRHTTKNRTTTTTKTDEEEAIQTIAYGNEEGRRRNARLQALDSFLFGSFKAATGRTLQTQSNWTGRCIH